MLTLKSTAWCPSNQARLESEVYVRAAQVFQFHWFPVIPLDISILPNHDDKETASSKLGESLITTIQKASLITTLSIPIVFWAYHVSSYILLSALKTPASLMFFLNTQSEETAFFSNATKCLYRTPWLILGIICCSLFFLSMPEIFSIILFSL